jgi:DNA-binding Lrp family transcriptional regulator
MTALRTPKPTVDVMRLLNPWQHHFPLVAEPYADLARVTGESVGWVLAQLEEALRSGALSRIGGVFSAQAGGAALLAAMRVPLERLEAVAAQVSAHLGVNHNYEREADYNLWFVMTARCPQSLEESLQRIERETGLQVLRLRMIKPYRIDLGFDLTCAPQARLARSSRASQALPSPIAAIDQPLAALVEEGLPLVERPFQVWADALGRSESSVLTTLATWVAQGTLRRFGTVVRHHELGFGANAMTVFDVPDAVVDVHGERLSQCPGVTLAYRRERATEWPFNLYCMVHGREREEVLQLIDALTHTCGLTGMARQVLFSRQRFKQVGGRRFRSIPEEAHHA